MIKNSITFYWRKYHFLYIFLLLLGACAKIVSPTGGPKDEIAPQIIGGLPEQGSNNISAKEISIEFDEFVELSNSDEIIISPYTDPPPEIKIRGKKIIIQFEEDLKEDITYHIDFKDAIQDINERNKLETYAFVFSTGEKIDSVELQGKLVYSTDGKAAEGVLVGLYPPNTDSIFLKEPPLYIGKTDKEGKYYIRHIKPGNYELTALEDKNFNDYFDLPNEQIAFLEEDLVLADSMSYIIDLQLFEEAADNRVLNLENNFKGHFVIELEQSNAIVETKWLGTPILQDSFSIEPFEDKKIRIKTYYQDSTLQRIALLENDVPFDTIDLQNQPQEPADFELEVTVDASRTNFLNQGDTLKIKGSHWVQSIDLSDALLKIKDSLELPLNQAPIQIQENNDGISIFYDWEVETAYTLVFPPNGLTSYYGQTSDSLELTFFLRDSSEYGDLTMKIANYLDLEDPNKYFYQLKNEAGKELERGIVQDSLIRFTGLLAKKYAFSVTEDLNQNNKWDSGIYATKQQPERIYVPQEDVKVKANWETEILLLIE